MKKKNTFPQDESCKDEYLQDKEAIVGWLSF